MLVGGVELMCMHAVRAFSYPSQAWASPVAGRLHMCTAVADTLSLHAALVVPLAGSTLCIACGCIAGPADDACRTAVRLAVYCKW
jgi:hypothetical protein